MEVHKSEDNEYVLFRSVEIDDPPIQKIGEAVGNFILWPTRVSTPCMYAAVVKSMKYTLDIGWIVCNNNLQRAVGLCFVDET